MSRPEILDYPAYLARWRALHGLEEDRLATVLDRYYRLPYALARPLARRGANPNLVTLLGLLVAAASVVPYLAGGRWIALGGALVLLSGLCDQLDGAVAVMTRRESTFGAIWDSVADRIADLLMLAGPAAWLLRDVGGTRAAWATAGLAVSGATLSLLEFTRTRCHAVGYVSEQVVTPAERPTRVIADGVAGLLAGTVGGSAAVSVWIFVAWAMAALSTTSVAILLTDAARRAGAPSGPATPTR